MPHVSGQTIERLIREADAILDGLEREAIRRLDLSLTEAIRRLEAEASVLYRRSLREVDGLSLPVREARARVLVAQLRALRTLTQAQPSLFDDLVRDAAQVGVNSAMASITLYEQNILQSFGVGPRFDAAALATNANARLLHHGEDFARVVEDLIIRGFTTGHSWSRLARELRAATGASKGQAEMLIRTESITASDEARRASYQQLGVEYTQLIATMDDRVCGYCAARAGNVYVLGELVLPLHPNCRCFSQPWSPDWQAAGWTDDDWYRAHKRETIDRARRQGHQIHTNSLTPSEKWRGRLEPPRPVWTPDGGYAPQRIL